MILGFAGLASLRSWQIVPTLLQPGERRHPEAEPAVALRAAPEQQLGEEELHHARRRVVEVAQAELGRIDAGGFAGADDLLAGVHDGLRQVVEVGAAAGWPVPAAHQIMYTKAT